VPAGESFTAESEKVVLKLMNKAAGIQTKSDMEQFKRAVAAIGKTEEANEFINNAARAMVKREIEKSEFYEDYEATHKTLKGERKAWRKHIRGTPMIAKNLKTPEGLPFFYFQFEEGLKEINPTATRKQIIAEWKKRDKAAGKKKRKR
jgi:hypothetical protein